MLKPALFPTHFDINKDVCPNCSFCTNVTVSHYASPCNKCCGLQMVNLNYFTPRKKQEEEAQWSYNLQLNSASAVKK